VINTQHQQKTHEPLNGQHAANDIPQVGWKLHYEGRETLKLHPCNKRRKSTK